MDQKEVKKYVLILIILILIAVSFLIIKPFISEILSGVILAYIFFPVYNFLRLKLKNKYLASTITLVLIILIIIVPLVISINALIKESITLYRSNALEKISDLTLKLFGPDVAVNQFFEKLIEQSVNYINSIATKFIISIPSKIFSFIIMSFIIFYMLLNGEEFLNKIKKVIPIKDKEEIIAYTGKTIQNLIYGLLIIAILEFFVTAVGFWIIGISTPTLWGIVVAVLAFIPIIGPAMVWVPFMILNLIEGNINATIGILIVGIILSLIDNILRHPIMGSKANIHPIIALLGVLGGLSIFGISGIIIGPLLLSLSIVVITIYTKKWS